MAVSLLQSSLTLSIFFTHDNFDEELDGQRWHFGLFLQQQWLHDQGQDIINQLQTLRQANHSP